MKVLGPYKIGAVEQHNLAPGASWDLPRAKINADMLAKAKIGDLFWLQEPWSLYTSRRFTRQNISEVAPGPVGTAPSAFIRPFAHELRLRRFDCDLAKSDSRITLEIMGFPEHAVRVVIHFQKIGNFQREREAARA